MLHRKGRSRLKLAADPRISSTVRESGLWQRYLRHRYAILFYALLLTLLVMPIAGVLGLPQTLIQLLLAGSLLAATMPNATRRTRLLLAIVVFLLVAGRAAAERGYLPIAPGLSLVIVAIAGLLTAAGALLFAVQADEVKHEAIYAALSTYLLAGLFFGQLYWSIEQMAPGSLTGPEPLSQGSLVYYSFVTLGSLGYGDILPKSDLVRGLAVFELIGGQLYLAVLVARLVSLFGNGRRAD